MGGWRQTPSIVVVQDEKYFTFIILHSHTMPINARYRRIEFQNILPIGGKT